MDHRFGVGFALIVIVAFGGAWGAAADTSVESEHRFRLGDVVVYDDGRGDSITFTVERVGSLVDRDGSTVRTILVRLDIADAPVVYYIINERTFGQEATWLPCNSDSCGGQTLDYRFHGGPSVFGATIVAGRKLEIGDEISFDCPDCGELKAVVGEPPADAPVGTSYSVHVSSRGAISPYLSPGRLDIGASHPWPLRVEPSPGDRYDLVEFRPGHQAIDRFDESHSVGPGFEPQAWADLPPEGQGFDEIPTLAHVVDSAGRPSGVWRMFSGQYRVGESEVSVLGLLSLRPSNLQEWAVEWETVNGSVASTYSMKQNLTDIILPHENRWTRTDAQTTQAPKNCLTESVPLRPTAQQAADWGMLAEVRAIGFNLCGTHPGLHAWGLPLPPVGTLETVQFDPRSGLVNVVLASSETAIVR